MAPRKDNATYLSGEDFNENMRETGRFTYRDETGQPKFQVRRKEDAEGNKKCPVYRHVNRDGFNSDNECNWERGGEDNRIHKEDVHWPYNLGALLELPKNQTAYIVEGEPCVDAMTDLGLVSVCNMFGALSGSWLKEYKQYFEGRDLTVVFADADLPGRRHANAIRHSLRDSVSRIIVISFPELGLGADIKDLVAKEGKNRALEMINERVTREVELLQIMKADFSDELVAAYCKKYKIGKREAAAQIKAAKDALIQGDKDAFFYYIGERDEKGRVMLLLPPKDARLTESVEFIDSIMATDEAIPPFRSVGADAHPMIVAECEPAGLHQLTRLRENTTHTEISRLPHPKLFLLARLTKSQMTFLIEQYVWHYKLIEKDDCVIRVSQTPHEAIVNGLMEYRASKWPKVRGVQTTPLVLNDGEIIRDDGLHRDLKMIFKIDEELRRMLPPKRPTEQQIREAVKWLHDNWFCDVLTNADGFYTSLALCLSILERALFPERPVFWVTAGKRGGGKTTLLNMISMAVLGVRAPATAWSDNEDERRKSIFAAARQGVPMICFDNLPKGDIWCPHVEKFSTADTYSDRVLKESAQETVSAAAIIAFTGNNIQPIGDLSSRSLMIHIIVKVYNPESRHVKHVDPVGWTQDHRGKILQCLYTILLGNPRLYEPAENFPQAKTRFKEWYHLVGYPIEYAAKLCGYEEMDFDKLFHTMEEQDESVSTMGETLNAFRNKFGVGPKSKFNAKKVCELMDDKSQGNEFSARAQVVRNYMTDEFGNVVCDVQRVGIRLRQMIENPTLFGDDTLSLQAGMDNVTHTRIYWVDGPDKL